MRKLSIFFLFLFLITANTYAQTEISGNIDASYEWFFEMNPYYVTDNLTLINDIENPDLPFVIPGGIEFIVSPQVRIDIVALNFICGESEPNINPVLFTAADSSQGWFGMSICSDGSIYFDNVIFEYSNSSTLLFLFIDSDATINNCIFRHNERGGALTTIGRELTLTNTIIHHCKLPYITIGQFPYPVDGFLISNCTLYSDDPNTPYASTSLIELINVEADVNIRNSIVWSEDSIDVINVDQIISYCCLNDSLYPGEGVIFTDPHFVDSETGDFRLLPDSPCIDAGDPTLFDPDGSRSDIGAIPYQENNTGTTSRPEEFTFIKTYPNPFNPRLTITTNLAKPGLLNISVYNMLGKKIQVLQDGIVQPGQITYTFNASNLPSGTYFIRAKSDHNGNEVRKVVLMK